MDLSDPADIIIDLHTAGVETVPHIYFHESQKDHASGLDIPHLLSWKIPSESFADTNFKLGKIALTFELSSSRSVNEKWIDKLPAKTNTEQDMLDMAFEPNKQSRLSCQIVVNEDLDGLVVKIP